MEQRVSVITLGVADLDAAVRFYTDIVGWEKADSPDGVAFFDLGGTVLSLYPLPALQEDFGGTGPTSGNRFTLAYNARNQGEVDTIFATLKARGATIVKEPETVFWGGYSGYFADVDGHLWEVTYIPFWPITEDGKVVMQSP